MKITGWDKFQGYKKRGPDWIKLHLSLLDKPQFLGLPVVARAVLPSLWLTAARISEEGELPDDIRVLAVLSHVAEAEIREAFPALVAGGFISCDKPVATTATVMSGEKRESRGEQRESIPAPSAPAPLVPVVPSWSREACDDWAAHLGTPPGGRVGAALKPLVKAHGWERVRPLWREACESAANETDPSYFTPEVFARTFKARMATPKGRGKPTTQDRTAANLSAWIAAKEGA